MNWKATAIIFMVLFFFSLSINGYIIYGGFETAKNQDICAYEICNPEIHNSYYYDSWEKTCYCFIDGDEVKAEKLGGAQK